MNSVGIAFELMRLELEAEVESLNSEGAKQFHASKYDSAQQSIRRGKSLQAFCEKVVALENEWLEFFIDENAEPEDSDHDLTARKILSGTKSSKTGLLVRCSDGDVISEKTAADTLVKFVLKAGIERVAALSVYVNSENIVSRSRSRKYSETHIPPFYVKTHSSTSQKKRNIEQIAAHLEINCEVLIV